MRPVPLITLSLLACAALMPVQAQQKSRQQSNRQAYIDSIRKAVKSPTEDHELYRLVIKPEFDTTLYEAAKAGNDALVVELLQAYSGQGASDKARGGTALHWAAYYSNSTLLKILLDRGLDVNVQDSEGDTPLHHALGIGRVDIVSPLLEKGAKVNVANQEGVTPLMLAAGDNSADNTRAFLERGAEVNAQNKQGETALMFAARNGRLDNVKLLLSEGANVRLKDKQGRTALAIAEKSPGAPWASFHDSPGELDLETAGKLAAKAKQDKDAILRILKRAEGK